MFVVFVFVFANSTPFPHQGPCRQWLPHLLGCKALQVHRAGRAAARAAEPVGLGGQRGSDALGRGHLIPQGGQVGVRQAQVRPPMDRYPQEPVPGLRLPLVWQGCQAEQVRQVLGAVVAASGRVLSRLALQLY